MSIVHNEGQYKHLLITHKNAVKSGVKYKTIVD